LGIAFSLSEDHDLLVADRELLVADRDLPVADRDLLVADPRSPRCRSAISSLPIRDLLVADRDLLVANRDLLVAGARSPRDLLGRSPEQYHEGKKAHTTSPPMER
jgi:hypothetical protein